MALDLLQPEEAADLLLRTGDVDKTAANVAAARKVVALCGNLPLFVAICGGMVCDYGGDETWQEELVAMLEDDRLGVMEDGGACNVWGRLL